MEKPASAEKPTKISMELPYFLFVLLFRVFLGGRGWLVVFFNHHSITHLVLLPEQ